jgi:hypothetical protein
VVRWSIGEEGRELMLAANLSPAPVAGFPASTGPGPIGHVLWQEGEHGETNRTLGPWAVRWSIQDKTDGH